MNTLGQIDDSLSKRGDFWNSSIFHSQWGGWFIDTETWEGSIFPLVEYPEVLVNWISISYSIRQKVFEGQFIEAVSAITDSKWTWVSMIQVLWEIYRIISWTPGSTPEFSVKKAVYATESKIAKIARYAQMPVSNILNIWQNSRWVQNNITSTLQDIDTAKGLIQLEIQRQTQILLGILIRSPSLDGALMLYKIIFVWSEELPLELFTAEIDWLKNFLMSHKWMSLSNEASNFRKATFDAMMKNSLLFQE